PRRLPPPHRCLGQTELRRARTRHAFRAQSRARSRRGFAATGLREGRADRQPGRSRRLARLPRHHPRLHDRIERGETLRRARRQDARMFKLLLAALALLICDAPSASSAAEAPAKTDDKSAEKSSDKAAGEPDKGKSKPSEPQEKLVETKHSITINGQKVDYTAKAGTILLRDNEDKPTASIFHIAYTKDDAGDLSKRPITFSFNGGPGSSPVWLRQGLLG